MIRKKSVVVNGFAEAAPTRAKQGKDMNMISFSKTARKNFDFLQITNEWIQNKITIWELSGNSETYLPKRLFLLSETSWAAREQESDGQRKGGLFRADE